MCNTTALFDNRAPHHGSESRNAAITNSQGRKPLVAADWIAKAPEGRLWRVLPYCALVFIIATVHCHNYALAQTPTRRSAAPAAKQAEAGKSGKTNVEPAALAASPPVIAPVLFSKLEESFVKLKVGDTLPAMKLKQLGGADSDLASRFGKKATVVVFWKSDRRMSRSLLADLGPDVVEKFGPQGVSVIGVAVEPLSDAVTKTISQSGARFTNLLDADGKAFADLGKDKLPRVYLVDPQGKILWFDIEYSLATRRELNQALRVVVGEGKVSK